MISINEQKEELRKNISEMKQGSIEQMLLIIKYGLTSYFKSVVMFGSDSSVTQDNILIIKEMFEILRRERKMLNYILRNMDSFDINAAEDVVGMLDELNDETIKYYYGLINDIEDAAETGQEFRGYRPRREARTLINNGDSYIGEVVALGISFDDLKRFLGYEDEFWKFIDGKIKLIDTSEDIAEKEARVTPIVQNGTIVDIELLIPRITNLQTTTIAIELFEKAYSIYKLIGDSLDEFREPDSEEIKKKYENENLSQKAKELLKIKMVVKKRKWHCIVTIWGSDLIKNKYIITFLITCDTL